MKKLLIMTVAIVALGVFSGIGVAAPVTITLAGMGSVSGTDPGVNVDPFTGPSGSRQTVVTIDFAPLSNPIPYTKAKIEVHFKPYISMTPTTNWKFHIADSPTCDGGGEDDATTKNNAELTITNTTNTMDIFGADVESGGVEHLLNLTPFLPNNTNQVVTFNVENNSISWIQKKGQTGSIQSQHSGSVQSHQLFAIPDTDTTEGNDDSKIYLGLNRVVYDPANCRRGKGLQKVIITMIK